MKPNLLLFTIFLLFTFSYSYAQVNSYPERKLAIYLPEPNGDVNYIANLSSVKRIGYVTGLPYFITSNFTECLSFGAILFANPVNSMSLTQSQKGLLMTYVENGGCVIFSGLEDLDLLEFSGIASVQIARNRNYLSFISSFGKKELRWIDDEYEREIKLGSSTYGDLITSYGYYLNDGEMLAQYRSGGAGFVKVKRGAGYVYTLGLLWRDLIIRNNLDRDYQANRGKLNYFEATSDVIMLLVRGMFTEAVSNAVWISPAPYDSKAVLLISHDVSSHSMHIFANDFAQLEYERGISATYNITTHQFVDDLSGDNYTSHIAQMRLLLSKNHTIGSLSYGYFPDFSIEDIFPIGERLESISDYRPHYSTENNRTYGGTVFGEIGVSKMILERDLNTTVKAYRPGFLAVNPHQYSVLSDLKYHFSSSFTSPNVLTSFPFYTHKDRAMNGEVLPVMEIGLSISDEFVDKGEYPIDEYNWMDKAEMWTSVTEKYANNNSFTNILIHTNRYYKLDALEYFLDHISQDIYPMELTKYGEFWQDKNEIEFSSFIEGNIMKIYIGKAALHNDQFSFVVDYVGDVLDIEVYNESGELQKFSQKEYYVGTSLLYQKRFDDVQNKSVAMIADRHLLYQNYPNPFSYYTTIEYEVADESFVSLKVLDIYGRQLKKIVNENQLAGIYKIEFSAHELPKGIYFYQIQIKSNGSYTTETKKMIIK